MTQPASPIELLFSDAWHALAPHLPLVREYGVGRYQLDFAYLPTKLNIELDGREFHTNPRNFTRDRRRDRELQALGWQVRRFSGYEINHDVIACVREMVAPIDRAYQIAPAQIQAWQRAHPRPAKRPAPRSEVHPLRRDADRRTVPLKPAPPYQVNGGSSMTSIRQQALPPTAPGPPAAPATVPPGAQTGAARPRRSGTRAGQQRTSPRRTSFFDLVVGLPLLLLLLWLGTSAARKVLFEGWPRVTPASPAVADAAGAQEGAAVGGVAGGATALPGAPVAATMKRVQSARLNLRAQPGAKQPVITTLAQGTAVEVLAETHAADGGVWLQVRSGRFEGWVNGKYLK